MAGGFEPGRMLDQALRTHAAPVLQGLRGRAGVNGTLVASGRRVSTE